MALSGTICGFPTALLGMLRVADSDPRSSAKNTTMIAQLFPTASDRCALRGATCPLRCERNLIPVPFSV
jgi:hypothetical protein